MHLPTGTSGIILTILSPTKAMDVTPAAACFTKLPPAHFQGYHPPPAHRPFSDSSTSVRTEPSKTALPTLCHPLDPMRSRILNPLRCLCNAGISGPLSSPPPPTWASPRPPPLSFTQSFLQSVPTSRPVSSPSSSLWTRSTPAPGRGAWATAKWGATMPARFAPRCKRRGWGASRCSTCWITALMKVGGFCPP